MAFDSIKQRHIMGRFATGVTVVTTKADDELAGLTANAVASLSLDPPLVLVAVDRKAHSHAVLMRGRCFAMNILAVGQAERSNHFAAPGPKDFSGIPLQDGETGAPVFADALAWVDCRVVEILPGGDHDIFVGQIVAGDARDGEPLLYFGGSYGEFTKATP